MTAQVGDKVIYKGEKYGMQSEPLRDYLETRKDIKFAAPSTACWRGYYGTWEIREDKLYLIGLRAFIDSYGWWDMPILRSLRKLLKRTGYRIIYPTLIEVGVSYLFPKNEFVFASWYSGLIVIPQGKMLEYAHVGYASTFEKDLVLRFENGILVSEEVQENKENLSDMMKRLEKELKKGE